MKRVDAAGSYKERLKSGVFPWDKMTEFGRHPVPDPTNCRVRSTANKYQPAALF